ncbi:unnamed protein product [Moneuplotes crassus]|uniref:Mediator of RNA polymerase II transcription subunit 6 n=1 Tax=Euplotes crassus TaxID=5936 RepID=A0AAD2D8H0_EUPCR|nr:unnamed protein product [Moneuplotes crassus]
MDREMYKDQTGFSWHDPVWLQQNPLTEDTCISYFHGSIFYDNDKDLVYKATKINPNADDQGFRVTKSVKEYNNTLKCVSMYFIIDGIIFQAASLRAVLEERLERASFCLKNAIQSILKNGNHSLKEKVPWGGENQDDDVDYDFLFEESKPKRVEKILTSALNELDDL